MELQPNRPDGRTRQTVAPSVGSSGRTTGRHPENDLKLMASEKIKPRDTVKALSAEIAAPAST